MEVGIIQDLIAGVKFRFETFHRKEAVRKRIFSVIGARSVHPFANIPKYFLYAAACLVIFLSFWSYKEYAAGTEGRTVVLSEGTQVAMAADSKIHFNRITWLFERRLVLEGNASFDVVHNGRRFVVKTPMADVHVLGTSFSIDQCDSLVDIACSTGTVMVRTKTGEQILEAGESLRYDGETFTDTTLPEYLEYDVVPLPELIDRLAGIYGLEILGMEKCQGKAFSGVVPTQDLDLAVQIISLTCEIDMSMNGKHLIIK